MIALISNNIWQHQQKWFIERQMKEKVKQSTAMQALIARKQQADNIRKSARDTWKVNELTHFYRTNDKRTTMSVNPTSPTAN
jgi:hypothetical protein